MLQAHLSGSGHSFGRQHCSCSSLGRLCCKHSTSVFQVLLGESGDLSFRNYVELKYMLHNGISFCSMGGVTAFRLYYQHEKSSILKFEIDLYCLLQSNESEYPHYFTLECSSGVSNIKKEVDNVSHSSAERNRNWMVQRLVK